MSLFNDLNLLKAIVYFGLFLLVYHLVDDDVSIHGYLLLVLLFGAGLWKLILWIAKIIGSKIELEEDKLLKVIDDVIEDIGNEKTSKIDISTLKQDLINRVQSKQIKCINDIVKSIGELTK